MNSIQVIIGRTKDGKIEVMPVRYECRKGRRGVTFCEPTKEARMMLKKFEAWQNLSEALEHNQRLQVDLRKLVGECLL